MDFTKPERKLLRDAAGAAHDAELRLALNELDEEFARWRGGEMESFELLEAIHEFHQHRSRDLWSLYRSLHEPELVARGLALGFIAQGALPAGIAEKLLPLVQLYAAGPQAEG